MFRQESAQKLGSVLILWSRCSTDLLESDLELLNFIIVYDYVLIIEVFNHIFVAVGVEFHDDCFD